MQEVHIKKDVAGYLKEKHCNFIEDLTNVEIGNAVIRMDGKDE